MQKKEVAECEKFSNMIGEYLCDNLSEQEKYDFLMHIEGCPECRAELEEIQAIIGAAAEIEEVEVPDALRASVSAVLAAEERVLRKRIDFRKFVYRTILPVAACAALAVGIYSGGLYDKFVNSDDILSTGEKTRTEEVLPEADTDNQIKVPENTEAAETSVNENITEKVTPEKTDNIVNKDKIKTSSVEDKSKDIQPETKQESVDVPAPVSEGTEASKPAEEKEDTTVNEQIKRSLITEEPVSGGGGGSAAGENAGIAVASAEELMADDEKESEKDTSEKPAAPTVQNTCTVVTDDPVSFAEGFGVTGAGDVVSFSISKEQWRDFIDYCRDTGAEVNSDFSQPEAEFINVTVVKN